MIHRNIFRISRKQYKNNDFVVSVLLFVTAVVDGLIVCLEFLCGQYVVNNESAQQAVSEKYSHTVSLLTSAFSDLDIRFGTFGFR